jgi:uncharacterized membrane protein
MIKTVEEYLVELRMELNGSDMATIQDALADAEDHLRTAMVNLREGQPDLDEMDALQLVIQQYGSPSETAAAFPHDP